MPYSSNDELPESVRSKYSDKCQRAFRHAFNSTHEDTGDEGKAMASGHAAAQRCEEANKSMDMIEGAISVPTEFKIFTGLLKTSRSPDGKMRLHGVASSTTRDLHGDVMLASAIEDMERAANNNLTIFLNHSYNVPEDVGGSVERAKSVTKGVDHEGNPNIDLNLDVLVNDVNDRAVQTFGAIERGTKLGLSIGAMIPPGGAKRNKDGTYVIEHVDLLETSIVGIPANPRSWVEYAVKALNKNEPVVLGTKSEPVTMPVGQPTLTLDNDSYTITGSLEGATVNVTPSTSATTNSTNVTGDFFAPNATTVWPVITTPNGIESIEVVPDVEDAQVTIIQIDTSDGDEADDDSSSQEAPESSPENEGTGLLDETADGDDAALGDTVTNASPDPAPFSRTLDLLRETTRELVEARKALAAAETAKAAAESERQQMVVQRDRVLIETKQILDRVAESPLVRRTVVQDAQRAFRNRFEGIYSEDILKLLERNENE